METEGAIGRYRILRACRPEQKHLKRPSVAASSCTYPKTCLRGQLFGISEDFPSAPFVSMVRNCHDTQVHAEFEASLPRTNHTLRVGSAM